FTSRQIRIVGTRTSARAALSREFRNTEGRETNTVVVSSHTDRFWCGSARDALVAALLAAVTIAPYWQVHRHAFVNYDDPMYVTANPVVRGGLSASAVFWAFTTLHGGNWHPLTWLSHTVDCTLFGVRAGPQHVVSVALHVASTVVLYAVLLGATRARWPSALVAALFALHPLHVESVAWIAERKDVLSTLCWLLALGAYTRRVARPTAARYALV